MFNYILNNKYQFILEIIEDSTANIQIVLLIIQLNDLNTLHICN